MCVRVCACACVWGVRGVGGGGGHPIPPSTENLSGPAAVSAQRTAAQLPLKLFPLQPARERSHYSHQQEQEECLRVWVGCEGEGGG